MVSLSFIYHCNRQTFYFKWWVGVAVSMRHLTAKLTLIPTPTQENGPEERIAPAQLRGTAGPESARSISGWYGITLCVYKR
jgi:hypothetical protein